MNLRGWNKVVNDDDEGQLYVPKVLTYLDDLTPQSPGSYRHDLTPINDSFASTIDDDETSAVYAVVPEYAGLSRARLMLAAVMHPNFLAFGRGNGRVRRVPPRADPHCTVIIGR